MWPCLVKILYTELKLLCGNLCRCPPAIPNHIIQNVCPRRAYKKVVATVYFGITNMGNTICPGHKKLLSSILNIDHLQILSLIFYNLKHKPVFWKWHHVTCPIWQKTYLKTDAEAFEVLQYRKGHTVIVVMSRRVMGIKSFNACRWSGGNKTPGVNLVIKCVVLQVN